MAENPPIVEPTIDPWYTSEKAQEYFSQILKNAVEKIGYVLQDISFAANYATIWGALTPVYMATGSDWDAATKAAKDAAEKLTSKLVKVSGAENRYELDDDDVPISVDLANGPVVWFWDGLRGERHTQWFPTSRVVTITVEDNDTFADKLLTVGFLRHELHYGEGGYSSHIDGYSYFAVNLEERNVHDIQVHTGNMRSTLDSYAAPKAWRLAIREHVWQSFLSVRIEVLYDYAYTSYGSTPRHYSYHDLIARSDLLTNDDPKDPEDMNLMFSYVGADGSVPAYHIGDDITHVDSLTGGNGADAGPAKATTAMLGQGGNGGHGGGGAGAAGFCKMETIYPGGAVDVDITAKVGTYTAGTGGLGTEGTPGYHGGCIIFYNRFGGANNA